MLFGDFLVDFHPRMQRAGEGDILDDRDFVALSDLANALGQRINPLRQQDGREYTWGFNGGTPNYKLRIPEGDYQLTYTIARDVWPDVAWGSAAMGIKMPAHLVLPDGPPK